MNCKTALDYKKICMPMAGFLDADFREEKEEVEFRYCVRGMRPATEILKEEKEKKYQFLINFGRLEPLYCNYQSILSMENLYYDENYIPHIKERDLCKEGRKETWEDFLFLYQSFVGGILGRRYSVTQIQQGGLGILKRDGSFREYYNAESTEVLTELLRERKQNYVEKQKKTKVHVSKNEYRIKSVCTVVTPLLLAGAVGGMIYLGHMVVPYQEKLISANEAYVGGDYVACIDSMKTIAAEQMDIHSKYILADSYARGESLKKEEIEEIVSRLSVQSDEKELEYWIYLGRQKELKAQELAQSLSDDKLLIYAYMKELDRLKSNTSMDGEEKQTRISELESAIKNLGDKYAPDK